jgi:hypothetical protein
VPAFELVDCCEGYLVVGVPIHVHNNSMPLYMFFASMHSCFLWCVWLFRMCEYSGASTYVCINIAPIDWHTQGTYLTVANTVQADDLSSVRVGECTNTLCSHWVLRITCGCYVCVCVSVQRGPRVRITMTPCYGTSISPVTMNPRRTMMLDWPSQYLLWELSAHRGSIECFKRYVNVTVWLRQHADLICVFW